jgi:hypothetical protein
MGFRRRPVTATQFGLIQPMGVGTLCRERYFRVLIRPSLWYNWFLGCGSACLLNQNIHLFNGVLRSFFQRLSQSDILKSPVSIFWQQWILDKSISINIIVKTLFRVQVPGYHGRATRTHSAINGSAGATRSVLVMDISNAAVSSAFPLFQVLASCALAGFFASFRSRTSFCLQLLLIGCAEIRAEAGLGCRRASEFLFQFSDLFQHH